MNNMYYYVTWFQYNYKELHKDMLQCNHNVDHTSLNPYHLESDCWSHTMMVCKIAEIQNYDKVVQIAALLHDIGKPKARTVNPKNNHVRFFGHENISAELSINILNKMLLEEMITTTEMQDILLLITYHGEFYKNNDPKSIYEKFKYDKKLFILLTQLHYCDNVGRFSANQSKNNNKIVTDVLKYFKINSLENSNDNSFVSF